MKVGQSAGPIPALEAGNIPKSGKNVPDPADDPEIRGADGVSALSGMRIDPVGRSLRDRRPGQVGRPDVRPLVSFRDQSGPDRVLPNVRDPFFVRISVAQTVVEEIPLPGDVGLDAKEMFPAAHDARHALVRGKTHQSMEMVWH